jgi:hypothetical protein
MAVSPPEPNSNDVDTAKRSRCQQILYLRLRSVALAASLVFLAVCVSGLPAFGQEQVPQIIVGERKTTQKKDTGPRALAILQLKKDGKASLIPITILINGKFWDASSYMADPVPMALEPGTVYEAERSGNSIGLFTVGSALHSVAANAPNPWLGTGSWLPGGESTAKAPMKAENVPVGFNTDEEPPRLTRNPNATQRTPPANSAPSSTNTPPAANVPPAATPQSSDPDAPPRLTRGAPSSSSNPSPDSTQKPSNSPQAGSTQNGSTQPAPTQTAPTQTGSTQTAPNSTSPAGSTPAGDKPSDSKPATTKPANTQAAPEPPPSDSGADEAERPRLRRGKPVAEPPDDDIPGYSRFGVTPSATTLAKAAAAKTSTAADNGSIQSIPAISDAHGPEPRPYAFQWLTGEEGERRQQMQALAKAKLQAYLSAEASERIVPAAVPTPVSQTTRRAASSKTSKKQPEPVFENVQMIAYDLWNSNQPIIVFSAQAHLPAPRAGTPHSETDADLRYSITLVAYPDIYHDLHTLYSGVTDKYHLDVTPRLDLVDAVDADGDGRGELLFKETSDAGTGWVIYRATADKLWKLFDSLNPE